MDWNDSMTPCFSSMGLSSVLRPHRPSRAIMEGPLCHPGTKALIEQLQVVRGFNVGFRANRQPAVLALAIQGLCEASKPHGGEAYRSGLSGCATAIRLGIARHAAALPRPHSGIHPHADQHL